MRIRGAKTELEQAGMETDGMAESTSKLREQVAALTNVNGQGGFDIMQDENTFKSIYDIMLGIGQVWEQMSDIDQAALLELLAGKRQGNALAAVMTNLEDMQKALEVSENSAGSAMREHEIWLDSIDAKTQQFKASVESLSSTLFSTDMIKGVVDMGTGFIQTIDNVLQGMQNVSGLVPAIKGISVALATPMAANSLGNFFLRENDKGMTRIGSMASSVGATGKRIKNLFTEGTVGRHYATGEYTTRFNKSSLTMFGKLAGAVNIYTAGIAAAVAALVAMYAIMKKIDADKEKRRANAEKDAENLKERSQSLDELRERYKQLSKELNSGDLSAEEALSKRMEIADIQEQISALVGDEAGKLDLVNGKLSEQLALMDDIQAAQYGKWKADNAEALETAKLEYTAGYQKVYDMSASGQVRANKTDKEYLKAYNAYVEKVRKTLGNDIANQFAGNAFEQWSLNLSSLDAEDALDTTKKLIDLLDDMAYDENWSTAMQEKFEGLKNGLEGAEQATQSLVDKNKLLIETYATGELQNNRKYQSIWSELLAAQNEYNKAVEAGDVEAQKKAFDAGKDAYKKFQEGIESGRLDDKAVNSFYEDYYNDWAESISDQEIEVNAKLNIKQNAESLKNMMADVKKAFNKDGKLDLTAILDLDWKATRGDSLADFSAEQIESFKQIAIAASEAGVSVGDFLRILSEEGVISLDDSQLQYLSDTIANISNDAEALSNLEIAINYDLNGDGVVGQVKEDIEELEGDHEVNIDINGDEAYDAVKRYVKELELAKEVGADVSKQVYGNVDLSNRQKLQWGEKELYDNRKTLKSWGYSQKDIDQLRGSFSTVMGMSGDFGQNGEIKIAFTPMLQTPNGAKILDQNTVNTYMNTLIDQVTQGGSKAFDAGELLRLDAAGLEVDGQVIKGLIADIGATAEKTGEQMHSVDSFKDAFQEVSKYASAAGMSLDEYVSKMMDIPEEEVAKLNLEVNGEKDVEKASKDVEEVEGDHKSNVAITTKGTKDAEKGKKVIDSIPNQKNTLLFAKDNASSVISKVSSALSTVPRTITVTLGARVASNFQSVVDYVRSFKLWTGTTHATEGLTLVGERGEELVQSKDRAYFVGTDHPEVVWLKQGDIVYNAEETKLIKSGNKVVKHKEMPALASGTNNTGRLTSSYTSTKTRSSFNFLPANGEKGDNFKLEEQIKDTLEAIDKKVKETLNNYEHQILIMEKNNVDSKEYIQVYKDMQAEVSRIANEYRSKGLNDNSDYIQDLQKQWFDYADKIKEIVAEQYEETRKVTENAIDLNTLWMQNAVDTKQYDKVLQYSQNIVQNYKYLQEQIHEQAEYYRKLGYTDTSDEVSELSKLWYEYRDKIIEATTQAYAEMVDTAGEAVDNIQSLYSTLLEAGEQYAESGHITIDTFQDLVSLGTKYLAFLYDENGMLVINEEAIKRVLAAKTKELAINEALNYVAQIRSAVETGNIAQIDALCDATSDLTNATWKLVYAQLSELNISDEQYRNALTNINRLRALSEEAINNIDHELNQMKGDAGDILEYVKEMVKQEVENHIEALEGQVKHYNEIVDLQKESLKLEKDRDEYSKKIAKQTKSIAELQAKIEQLRLDNSREATAQRLKLEEELAEKQEQLSDDQSDHSYEATTNALDKMAEAYEKEKNEEIKILQNTISSEEKIYQMAIARIDKGWDSLYDDLIKWNTEYGSHLNMDITDAWEEALKMAQKYGDYLTYLNVKRETDKNGNTVYTNGTEGRKDIVGKVVDDSAIRQRTTEMLANSEKWLAYENQNKMSGTKFRAADQKALADRNAVLASELEELIGEKLVRGTDGVWYLGKVGGRKLYSVYPAYTQYHTGGIVGDRRLFDDEEYALLQKGEVVLTPTQQENLYRRLDAFETMYDKFGKVFNLTGAMPTLNTALYSAEDVMGVRGMMNDNSVTTLTTTVNVSVHGAVDDEAMAKRYGEQIGNETIRTINDAFYKRGINRSGNVLLKQ